jgi:hypothetical protein
LPVASGLRVTEQAIYSRETHDKRNLIDPVSEAFYSLTHVRGYREMFGDSHALLVLAADQRRLSRVAEGTGPMMPQQPGSNAQVLLPAQ